MFSRLKAAWDRLCERFRFDAALMATLEEHERRLYAVEEWQKLKTPTITGNTDDIRKLKTELRGKLSVDVRA